MKHFFLLALFLSSLFSDAHIFIYHRFDDAKHKSTSISTKQLTKQFNLFKKKGYKVVKTTDILDKLEKGEDIPQKWVALHIDDSYKTFLKNGLPVFKKFNYPFTIFTYVKGTNKRYGDFLSWKQLKDIKKYGDVQYHSYTHPRMVGLTSKEIKEDFVKGLEIFEKKMGYKATQFAYPYGEFDERVKKIAKSYNFRAIFNQNNLGAISKNSDIHDISRSALNGSTNFVLRMKDLNATFISPTKYPKNRYIKEIVVKVDKKYKKVEIFITKNGWKWVKVKNGIAKRKINFKFKKTRLRMAVKTQQNEIKAQILVKGR